MITYDNSNPQNIFGKSTDTKPLTAQNGSFFIEINTGKIYVFDAEAKTWLEFGS